MTQAYIERGKTGTAVFEFFARKLPPSRGFLIAAGLDQALDFLDDFKFSSGDIEWLAKTGRFDSNLLNYLTDMRFTGDVHAMPEGTIFFPDEPILRVTAPLPEAQMAESRLINILHFQTLIASKAARHVLLAPGKLLVDFGFRRAHWRYGGPCELYCGIRRNGHGSGRQAFDIPLYGTMAHSFIEAFDDEAAAFLAFAKSRPTDTHAPDRYLRH